MIKWLINGITTNTNPLRILKYQLFHHLTHGLDLNYSLIPSKATKTLVFLHGLLGNQNNWRSISNNSAIRYRRQSVLPDLRNHGDSPHHPSMTFPEMADDVVRLMDKLRIHRFTLLGHSMGGKTAMAICNKYPQRVDGVIIVDVFPKDFFLENVDYILTSKQIIEKANNYNIAGKSRKQVNKDFQKMLGNSAAAMLNTNLKYISRDVNKVRWRANLPAIQNNLRNIFGNDIALNPGRYYEGDVLILLGEKSRHFPFELFSKVFPKYNPENVSIVKGAGHWVHIDRPLDVIKKISKFLDKIDQK